MPAAINFKCKHLVLISLVLFPGLLFAQRSLSVLRIDQSVVEQRLSPLPKTHKERLDRLRQQFRESGFCGAKHIQEQVVPGQAEPNLICRIPGTARTAIVIGVDAAYKSEKTEAMVQWSGLAMLPLLAESLGAVECSKSLVLVAFTGGKGSKSGASWFLEHLDEDERKEVEAFIQLDHIGRTPPSFAPGRWGGRLGLWLIEVARAHNPDEIPSTHCRGLDASTGLSDCTITGTASGVPAAVRVFDAAKIPTITIYSRSQIESRTLAIYGVPVKVLKRELDPKAYYGTYTLVSMYLRRLDQEVAVDRKATR